MKYTNDEMLAEIRRVARRRPLSRPMYQSRNPAISAPAIIARFGSWLNALKQARVDSPFRFGGIWKPCPICGASFRTDNSKRAKVTCGSRACVRQRHHDTHSKGNAASLQAARGRAAAVVPRGPCERCGAKPGKRDHDRHHKDRNPYNNDRSNLERLCRKCHVAEHRSAGDGWSTSKAVAPA